MNYKDLKSVLKAHRIYNIKLSEKLEKDLQEYAEEQTRELFKKQWSDYKELKRWAHVRKEEHEKLLREIYNMLKWYYR